VAEDKVCETNIENSQLFQTVQLQTLSSLSPHLLYNTEHVFFLEAKI
jgi:hypothetical protein